ncbi:MAG: AAA family ATPase [Nanoarchaeota archaeon]|nr:AAA family ATPase [Nanoarchaeota archaeon]
MTRVIGIVSGKGGVGKTTVSSNLAVSLVKNGKKVLLVDFNPTTPHLNFHFGIYNYVFTINDLISGKSSFESAIFNHSSGVDVIPGSLSTISNNNDNLKNLKSVLGGIEQYDFVLLDAAPGFGREGIATLSICDEVLIVMNPTQPCVFDVLRLREVLAQNNANIVGIVMNMVRRQHSLKVADIEKLTGIPVSISIHFDGNIIRSLSKNLPINLYKPKSKTSRKFDELALILEGEKVKKGVGERLRSLVEIMLIS